MSHGFHHILNYTPQKHILQRRFLHRQIIAMRMALPGMNRKEAKREQARPRSISRESPMEATQPEKPGEPCGTYGPPGCPVGCSHGCLRRWAIDGSHTLREAFWVLSVKKRGRSSQSAQHPPPDWADNSETGREGPAIQGSGSGNWRLCVHKQSSEKKELPQTSNKVCTPPVH